jgi:hypothetical protein
VEQKKKADVNRESVLSVELREVWLKKKQKKKRQLKEVVREKRTNYLNACWNLECKFNSCKKRACREVFTGKICRYFSHTGNKSKN